MTKLKINLQKEVFYSYFLFHVLSYTYKKNVHVALATCASIYHSFILVHDLRKLLFQLISMKIGIKS